MTTSDLAILLDKNVQAEIERNLDLDPIQVALNAPAHGALIATQVKYLQKARAKLPSYYAARCLFTPLAFEQSSSEETAALKNFHGHLCIDLSCGLGVDAFHFSRRFDRVIALERDAVKAEIARINFSRLGATNIEVLTLSAEDFLNNCNHHIGDNEPVADLIYIDPDRRGNRGKKLFRLEDCSPNVIAEMPRIMAAARRMVIKASPLFDLEEAFRIFGKGITIEVISSHDECKEVLIVRDNTSSDRDRPGILRTIAAGKGSLEFQRICAPSSLSPRYRLKTPVPQPQTVPTTPNPVATTESPTARGKGSASKKEKSSFLDYTYLLVPDVSLYKARLVETYAQAIGIRSTTATGYCFANHIPADFFGRIYPIRRILPYRPKILKSLFHTENITRCNLLKKDFPLNAAQIASALGIREGGNRYVAFTCFGKERYALILDHD